MIFKYHQNLWHGKQTRDKDQNIKACYLIASIKLKYVFHAEKVFDVIKCENLSCYFYFIIKSDKKTMLWHSSANVTRTFKLPQNTHTCTYSATFTVSISNACIINMCMYNISLYLS